MFFCFILLKKCYLTIYFVTLGDSFDDNLMGCVEICVNVIVVECLMFLCLALTCAEGILITCARPFVRMPPLTCVPVNVVILIEHLAVVSGKVGLE